MDINKKEAASKQINKNGTHTHSQSKTFYQTASVGSLSKLVQFFKAGSVCYCEPCHNIKLFLEQMVANS